MVGRSMNSTTLVGHIRSRATTPVTAHPPLWLDSSQSVIHRLYWYCVLAMHSLSRSGPKMSGFDELDCKFEKRCSNQCVQNPNGLQNTQYPVPVPCHEPKTIYFAEDVDQHPESGSHHIRQQSLKIRNETLEHWHILHDVSHKMHTRVAKVPSLCSYKYVVLPFYWRHRGSRLLHGTNPF